jgi:hypothetical protein
MLKTILGSKKAISLNIAFITIYYLFYSIITQTTFITDRFNFSILILDDWYNKLFDVRAFPNYEPIGVIELGPLFITLPIPTMIIGLAIAALMGINLSISVYSWTNPKCRVNPVSGFLSSLPAFFSGLACCAPIFLVTLGSATFTTLFIDIFPFLIPFAFIFLILSILWSLNRLDANFNISNINLVNI